MKRSVSVLVPLALFLALGAGPLAAQDINGVYDGHSCAAEFRSEDSIRIEWPALYFYESQCTLTSATLVPGMETTYVYEASCSGEGEAWTRSYILTPNFEGGVVLVQDGNGQSYERCGG